MVAPVLGPAFLYLAASLVNFTANALQINYTGEVIYNETSVYGEVDKSVILECGGILPDIYIWSFTKPGTDAIKAVVYDLGKGPRIQNLAEEIGPLTVISSRAALSIEKLPLAAHGLFTCQAFFDNDDGVRACYYYVYLIVQVPVSKPYILISDEFPVEGSSMWMNCIVENGSQPIQYTWQHESLSGNIRNFSKGNNSIISVNKANRNYTGWYHCVASNAVNSQTSDRLLVNITFGPDVPQIDITPYRVTAYGHSPLETETVSFFCQAQSNPASQYVWFYNDSQIYAGPQFTIDKILRSQTGNYTCLAENSHLSTRSRKTVSLTVYYAPDGSPSCSVEAALNHTSLRLICSWPGGFPSPSLLWTGNLTPAGQGQTATGQLSSSAVVLLSSDSLTSNSGLFTCVGSHPALKQQTGCSTRSYVPPAEPLCFTNLTNDRQNLMLSCFWDGGVPKALVWWEGPGGQSQGGQENSNILVLRYGTARSGKPYTCYAKHPLLAQPKACSIPLVPVSKPSLQMSDASAAEGSTMWMRCNVENGTEPIHYVWQREIFSGNFTTFTQGNSRIINMTSLDRNHTGRYRCMADNAVNTESSQQSWLNITFGPDVPQLDVTPYRKSEQGFSILETENVSLLCQAQSNPASQYLWFYNNSQVSAGPQFSINKVLRLNAGNYTCLAQNSYLNTRSRSTISLIVYYPPDGSPSCSIEAALNQTSLRLICSWSGGFPPPFLIWTGDLIQTGQGLTDPGQQTNLLSTNILLPSGGLTPNSSLFMCFGSHPALKQRPQCSTRSYAPPAELLCFANVSSDKQYLTLSCSWDGGAPKALVWWEGPGGQSKAGEENSNVLVLRYSTFYFGKPYTCYAKHPLVVQTKTCSLTLVPISKPSLLMSEASPVEKSSIWMRCNVDNGTKPIQYVWQYKTNSGSITTFSQGNSSIVTLSNVNRSLTGLYRCVSSNFINSDSSDWLLLDVIFGPDVPQLDVTPSRMAEQGYSALESEMVSWSCQTQSNPACQYVWFYNNSQVYTGSQYTITKILRSQTGEYTCLAQNSNLNTRSKKSISLTVYYAPDGSPSCSVEAALNHTSLRLICSWPGGFPSPSLLWTGSMIPAGQGQTDTGQLSSSAVVLLSSDSLTSNSGLFTCVGSHPALKQQTGCSTRSYVPPADPVCFAYATNNQQYLMLSCSWDGGAPKALVWWEGPGGQSQGGQENSNILVLRYGTARSGKPYTCYAKHPLLDQPKTCNLTLEAPVLLTQRRVVSVYEGSDVQLTCSLRDNYLPVNEITWFNNQGVDVRDTSKYLLLQTSAWANLTVRDTNERQDSGEYRCTTSNAVGGADINVTLVVKKYPMPPNVTLVKVMYNSQQRNEVDLEWIVDSQVDGGWTGFFLEHQWVSEKPNKRSSNNNSQVQRAPPQDWYSTVIMDPDARTYTVRSLTPTVTYQFRVIPMNYRTIGYPSAAKTPVEQHNSMYPAVVGAAVGGMLFVAIPTVLFLVYIIRNRDSNPRLHRMLFGSQHSQSRENINFPEDELVRGSEERTENTGGPSGSGLGETSCPTADGK